MLSISLALTRLGQSTLYGAGTAAGLVLGAETSGLAADFQAATPNLLIRDSSGALNYSGDPFSKLTLARASQATRVNSSGIIETVSDNVARIDYDPSTLACLGFLVEEQRTNLALYSADFRTTAEAGSTRPWGDAAGATTATANYAAAPDGATSATRVVFTSSDYPGRSQLVSLSATTSYTFSAWIKRISGSGSGRFQISGSGVIDTVVEFTASTSWTRIIVTGTTTGAGNAYVYIFPEYLPARTGEYLIWGAQLEAGSFATSYIPTAAASATRAADACSLATSLFPYVQGSGSLVAMAKLPTVNQQIAVLGLNSSSYLNSIILGKQRNDGLSTGNNFTASMFDVASSVVALATTANNGAVHKVGMAWDSSGIAGVADGGSVLTGTYRAAVPTYLRIGGRDDGQRMCGHLRQITYIPRKLTNTELTARTV